MSIIGSNILAGAAGSGVSAYEIEQSLRFDGSSYLSWTPSSAGNRRTWTWSGWVKRGPVDTNEEDIFGVEYTTGDVPSNSVRFSSSANSDQQPRFSVYLGSGSDFSARYGGVARDPAAWMHFVAVWDTTNATESERMRFYINGEQQSRYYQNSITQNTEGSFNTTSTHRLSGGSTYGRLFKGYLAETHFVDGTALEATDFGEYDDNGVWRPIAYSGSYGTNGFYLKFDETATNGIGHDHSGNGNNWTASGFTTSGTGTDVMSDTPTNNHCTWNSLVLPSGYSSTEDGNLVGKFTNSANGSNMPSTFAVSSGKWYWETTLTATGSGASTGVALDTFNYSAAAGANYLGGFSSGWAYEGSSGNKRNSPTNTSYGSTYTTSDIIGIALDMGTGKIWWSKNGTWQASGDPAAGTNEAFSNITGTVVPAISGSGSGGTTTWTLNAGQRDFAYTPPTGFKALNTSNLPAPDIADGSQNMMPVLWTGTGAARTQAGYNFQPDLLWIMKRNGSGMNVRLYDVVRGDNGTVMYRLGTNNTDNEDVDGDVTGLTSTGFTIGNDGTDHPNASSSTYVGWGWKAAQNSGSSNTDGGTTATVSANPTAGFSIVGWAGSGTSTSVGHGLGVAPKLNIIKSRDSSSLDWYIYTTVIDGSHDYFYFTSGAKKNSGIAAPTSTVVNLNADIQPSGQDMIAYCFAEVESYSRINTYVGNGSSNGPFVFCGFRPAWVLVKPSSTTGSWSLIDSTRSAYNVADDVLFPNLTNAESTSDTAIDFLSNGFKLRSSNRNTSGATYLFVAFAENPFGGEGVSPATAR